MNESTSLFSSVIAHEAECDYLRRLVRSQRVPHAFVFAGSAGIGKRRVGREFALALLSGSLSSEPGTCESGLHELDAERVEKNARLLMAGNHPDFHVLSAEEGKRDISVEQIRSVRDTLGLRPYCSPCSVLLIDDAHRMNQAASNALLKTLEEPVGSSHIILVTAVPYRLLDTIVSRCQVLNFGLLSAEKGALLIEKIATSLELLPEQVSELIELFDGSLDPLGIAPFVDMRSMEIDNQKGLRAHLIDLAARVSKLSSNIKKLVSAGLSCAERMSMASEYSEGKPDPLFWQILKLMLRKEIMSSSKMELAAKNAQALWESIESERLINERNANPQLQLSCLFDSFPRSEVVNRGR